MLFTTSPITLAFVNARKQLSSVRCLKSDGTFCTDTPISNWDILRCGVRVTDLDQEECQTYGYYWNYSDNYCQDTPWYCDLEPEVCNTGYT